MEELIKNYRYQVDQEFSISPEERRHSELKDLAESNLEQETRDQLADLIKGEPEKLFEFGYKQYTDETAQLHHLSVPLIKLSGQLGYTPGLTFTASHCINRLDPNELAYGWVLLNKLASLGVSEAKLILGYIAYSGHRNLGMEPDFIRAACIFSDLIGEDCFLNDDGALTMLGILLESGLGSVAYNLMDLPNQTIHLRMTISEEEFRKSTLVVNGEISARALFERAAANGIPIAQCAVNAYNGDEQSKLKFAEAFRDGYFLSNPPEDESVIPVMIYDYSGCSGHWKGDICGGCLIPESERAAKKWNPSIVIENGSETAVEQYEDEEEDENETPRYVVGTLISIISAVLLAGFCAMISRSTETINFYWMAFATLLVGIIARWSINVKNKLSALICGIAGATGALTYVMILERTWEISYSDGSLLSDDLLIFIVAGVALSLVGLNFPKKVVRDILNHSDSMS